VIGHFVGYKSGHALNHKLIHKLLDHKEWWDLLEYTDEKEFQKFQITPPTHEFPS
jgi:UDP-3-O-acyl-N-acetylglucosamine deacetylase